MRNRAVTAPVQRDGNPTMAGQAEINHANVPKKPCVIAVKHIVIVAHVQEKDDIRVINAQW